MDKKFLLTQILSLLKCNSCNSETNCKHCKGTGLRFPSQQEIDEVISNLNNKEIEEWANSSVYMPN
ncbi:MAG: hypothetical protein ACD_20C00109G0032 [uncultured bacterium]|nr:MAG: hypothetical protein ACD_20C00109G0032 [uncultured bacterium]HBH17958.1 hypothetical protein [Cyanobacteria bacterium UBA9579]